MKNKNLQTRAQLKKSDIKEGNEMKSLNMYLNIVNKIQMSSKSVK